MQHYTICLKALKIKNVIKNIACNRRIARIYYKHCYLIDT